MNGFHLGAVLLGFTIVADAGVLWTIIRTGHFATSWRMLRGAV
jgi:hypothetical protein